ncbi:MAG: N-acetyltransferase [Candidatus Zixiibacteriota bacterium]|nr:MAG: N-acetyltransferase [candidate division Zixibacteria bacterium]
MSCPTLEIVGPGNLDECGLGCLSNRKHPGYQAKTDWLHDRFAEGLRLLLFRDAQGKPLASLETVPGESAWRPVEASGWLFVHCLWVHAAGQRVGGLGSRLIQACVEEARRGGFTGVAVLTSSGTWMAGPRVFLKNGFERVASDGPYHLVAYRLEDGPAPRLRELGDPAGYRGLHIIYADQCPMFTKSVQDVTALAAEHGIEAQVTRLQTAREAQAAPSRQGVYSLIWNGKLLADHYVSGGRFRNLLRDEILSESRMK